MKRVCFRVVMILLAMGVLVGAAESSPASAPTGLLYTPMRPRPVPSSRPAVKAASRPAAEVPTTRRAGGWYLHRRLKLNGAISTIAASGRYAVVGHLREARVTLLDLKTFKKVTSRSLGTGVAYVDVKGGLLAVSAPSKHTVSVFNLPSMKLKKRIKLAFSPFSVTLLDGHGVTMVADMVGNRMVKVDPVLGKVTARAPLPWPMGFSGGRGRYLVGSMAKSAVFVFDAARWLVADVLKLPRRSGDTDSDGRQAVAVFGEDKRNPAGARMYDLSTGRMLWTRSLPPQPRGVALTSGEVAISIKRKGLVLFLSRKDGKETGRYRGEGYVGAACAVGETVLVLQQQIGEVLVLRKKAD